MTTWALPKDYRWAGVYCGVKKNPEKRDVSLIVSDRPAAAAGVFTTNKVCAAPVQVTKRRVPSSTVRAVVINSGNANACTGEQGRLDAEAMTAAVATGVGCAANEVLVCSTGVIGRKMPMDKILAGVESATRDLGVDESSVRGAATGILTTDTVIKVESTTVDLGGRRGSILGFCKGAAMIGPNMATMLAFVVTDVAVKPDRLDRLLRSAVDRSFHCIAVEGHTSTNDTVLALANGASCADESTDPDVFARAFVEVCRKLSMRIIDDAEGATHVVTIDVKGCRDDAEAKRIAKEVADSALVKSAIFGNDPNWGRICSAAGYAGVDFREEDMSLRVNGVLLYDRGAPTPFDHKVESDRMKSSRDVAVELTFTLGTGSCRYWTSDLSYEYVRQNAEYTT